MDTHVQRLGVWSIAFGIAAVVGSLLTLWYFGGVGGIFHYPEDARMGFISATLVLTHLLIGLPSIFTGYYLRRFNDSARVATIALCTINIINVPIGTVVGIYGLWVLTTPETDPLFAPHSKRPATPRKESPKRASEAQRQRIVGPHHTIKTAEPE